MNEISTVVSHSRCPKCYESGRDRSGDNLATYSDGHKYCFSCGHFASPNIRNVFAKSNVKITPTVLLPSDCDISYPIRALQWMAQYELTRHDLLSNNVLWSESRQRLIFPVFADGVLLAYQGRYFGEDSTARKWWGTGDFKNIFAFKGKASRSIVLVEDVVSAIKISRFTQALWLSGCVIGKERWKRLFKLIPKGVQCIIWLDPDKRIDSIKEARVGASYGLCTSALFSDKDPKEHSYVEIEEYLSKKDLDME